MDELAIAYVLTHPWRKWGNNTEHSCLVHKAVMFYKCLSHYTAYYLKPVLFVGLRISVCSIEQVLLKYRRVNLGAAFYLFIEKLTDPQFVKTFPTPVL
jgi:hypothetical protein